MFLDWVMKRALITLFHFKSNSLKGLDHLALGKISKVSALLRCGGTIDPDLRVERCLLMSYNANAALKSALVLRIIGMHQARL